MIRLIAARSLHSMHVTAIIAAAGEGRRLGAAVPKQLLEIGGRSILERSVAAFVSHERVNDVIVVLPAALAEAPPEWMARATPRPAFASCRVARGDRTRSRTRSIGSVRASDVVLVHDAARPFVSSATDLARHRCGAPSTARRLRPCRRAIP